VCRWAEVAMGEVVFFAHGSTIATNALVERNLAKAGLLTTKGFRDVERATVLGVWLL
jgi:N-methylhydantoinase A